MKKSTCVLTAIDAAFAGFLVFSCCLSFRALHRFGEPAAFYHVFGLHVALLVFLAIFWLLQGAILRREAGKDEKTAAVAAISFAGGTAAVASLCTAAFSFSGAAGALLSFVVADVAIDAILFPALICLTVPLAFCENERIKRGLGAAAISISVLAIVLAVALYSCYLPTAFR